MLRLLAVGWGAVVVAAASSRRPLPAPRLSAVGLRAPADHRPGPSWRAIARVAGPAVAVAVVHPALALLALGDALARPLLKRRRARAAHGAAIEAGVVDAVALLALAVGAGHNLLGALRAVAPRARGPVGAELARVVSEADRGVRLADALDGMADRVGDAIRPLTAALVSCARYGAPIAPTLERLAADVRLAARQRAEAAARRVPVRLLFPLVSCILPAFALLTVAPLIAESARGLGL